MKKPPGSTRQSAALRLRAAPRSPGAPCYSLRGRAEEGAGDARVVVVGRADAHHQVGGRAQPAPASLRHQGAGSRQSSGLGVALLPANHST